MDNRQNSTNINWYPGHMAKTRREIQEKLPLIDLVYELVDARMPKSSKIMDIDQLLKNKPRILVMTKYDLCDSNITNQFIEFYRKKGDDVIALDLKANTEVKKLLGKTKKYHEKMNQERKNKGLKPRSIRVLIVGVPNVGKSTLINRLVSKKVAQTGDKPGVTKNINWIRIHQDIELLDSPGILWPKLENQEEALNLAVLSSIKEEILDKETLVRYVIHQLKEMYPKLLKNRYQLGNLDNFDEVIDSIARSRGCLKQGGNIDLEKTYTLILRDLQDGAIGRITLDRY